MPAINVAKTDTFEIQRQKINQIGNQIFTISQGGSDLATGNLKIGDGTRELPSLAFISKNSLGIYKSGLSTIGIASDGKIIADLSLEKNVSYQDFSVQKKIITTLGSSILTNGENYDPGNYEDIPLIGGTGSDATVDLFVDVFTGSLTNSGQNFNPGNYLNKVLIGGSGENSVCSFTVDGISGTTSSGGSGYIPRNFEDVPLQGGSGSGALADVTISGTVDYTGTIVGGSGYTDTNYPNIVLFNPPTQTFTVTSVANPGSPPPDNVYSVNGVTQPVLTLIKGNTYRFDMSDASNAGHPLFFEDPNGDFLNITNFLVTTKGTAGDPGAFVDILIKPDTPTQTIVYNCVNHDGMGANINVVDGTAGSYGTGIAASILVSGGAVTDVTIFISGENYQVGEVLTAYDPDLGGGSGFSFEITSITYNGAITDIVVTDIGQNYLNGDVLTINNSDLGGYGSGFSYTVTTDPGIVQNLTFTTKGIGTVSGDVLTLPGPVTGVTITLDGTGSTFTLPNVSTISVGDSVVQTGGTGTLGDGVTVSDVNVLQNEITLSSSGEAPGTATLTFTPIYGNPTTNITYTVASIGAVTSFDINNGGTSYTNQDVLSVSPSSLVQPIIYTVFVNAVQTITFTGTVSSSAFSVGDSIKKPDGVIESVSISSSTDILAAENQTFTGVAATGGSGSGATFDIERGLGGGIITTTINNAGSDYTIGDSIIIAGNLVGGSSPTDDITLNVDTATSETANEVYKVNSSGGNITSLVCACPVGEDYVSSDVLKNTSSPTTYTVDTASGSVNRYFIDIGDGNGASIYPDLSLYVGNVYKFDLVNASEHPFKLSKEPDGKWYTVEGITTSLVSTSKEITVSSTAGIFAGMVVTTQAGSSGALSNTTTYVDEVVDATTLTLTEFPSLSGTSVLDFAGTEYTDGVTSGQDFLQITVSTETPTLYYYCDLHPDMAGEDGSEASITIDQNNPKVFGSGFQLLVSETTDQDVIFGDVVTGDLRSISFTGNSGNITDLVSTTIESTSVDTSSLNVSTISSDSSISVTAESTFSSNVNIGTTIQIASGSGNLTTSGIIRSNDAINVSNQLLLQNSTISSIGSSDVIVTPASGRLAKVDSTTALQIPVGTTLERPTSLASDGSIRFNTTTGQYEGYNASTTSWSSLGGVRDIDGNTYILAELTAGANDNTLWFYNDGNNTVRLTQNFFDFRTVKKISSTRLGIPSFSLWTANTPVVIGQYLKYLNNIYEVTASGTTASSGNEPTHTSGVQNNGTAQLTWYSLAVSPLEFTEIEELRVAPQKNAPLIVNASLKIGGTTNADWNTIATLSEDLTLRPNPGKKVVIDSYTHLAIPAGNNNQKNTASAVPGSIRFNTEIQQFEGYSGTNWSSLGGVRDVDGNTYIIPETAPAANENILYFYNDNLNTMKLSSTALDFTNIDTITTSGLNNLSLDTPLVTLNLNETTIDNRDVTRTFISSSKQYLDLGLSSGLVVDPILRLDDQGDVYLNTTFGTGTFNGVKVFDGDLKEFELADYAIRTTSFSLGKGAAETSAVNLYPTSTNKGCKVTVVSKSSSGKRSMTEYHVIDNGTDIFYNEFGSLNTSLDQYTASFDYNAGEVRITLTLSDDHTNGDIISFTVLNQVIK